MTVHLKHDVIHKDIASMADIVSSAVTLRNRLCGKEKNSVWKVIGVCHCGGKIVFDVVAIFRNGSIISLDTSSLDDSDCPHCERGLSRHTTRYHSVHSHHTGNRN